VHDRQKIEKVKEEVAILVRVLLPDSRVDLDPLKELVFDNDLSPAQTRNLEVELGIKVIDRTELILDIFATHAQTYESRLAVELAQLEYSLPRLKRMWTHLSRLKMGVGMRGPGEKQLETDRRLVEKRIHDLKKELEKVEQRKERQVGSRKETMTVSLVGYTTVGFIRDLPHSLIASFKATLEETRQADLLLHVADASNSSVIDQISSVYDVLKEIGIEEKDALLVLNKTDQVENPSHLKTCTALSVTRFPDISEMWIS